MKPKSWEEILLPPEEDNRLWELFHENSKIDRFHRALSTEEVLSTLKELHVSLPYHGYQIVELPQTLVPLLQPVEQILQSRVSTRELKPCPLTREAIKTLLHYSYGITRREDKDAKPLPRPLRMVPSGGALYPLELFLYSTCITDTPAGLYHYCPSDNTLTLLREGDEAKTIQKIVVQHELIPGASLILFITAVFERSTFKYKSRGYRFIFLEAGHLAQNCNLVAGALGLGCANIGGFFDREVDDYLGIDGLTHSTIYIMALGGI